jgi:hypothetical protein
MYPAVEINLHLNRICAAQRRSPAAFEAAFRASTYGTNLLPFDASWRSCRLRSERARRPSGKAAVSEHGGDVGQSGSSQLGGPDAPLTQPSLSKVGTRSRCSRP